MDQYYNDLKNKYNQEAQSFQNNAQQLVDQQAQNVQKLNQSYKGAMASSITGGDAYSIPTAPAGVTINPPVTVSPTPTTPTTQTTPTTFYTNIPTTPTTETTPTTPTTTTPTQADMDAMKDLYPSLQYPSDINPVQTPTTTPTATVPSGSSVEDYVNYYKSLGVTTPDKSYDEWVAWKNGTGTPTTTTPSQPTSTPTQTEPTTVTPTPSPAAGLSVSDYINYYKNLGVTTPDKSYDEWYSWMQSGGPDSSASTPTTGTPTTGTPTTGDTQAAADIVAEWNALIAKYQAGTLTLEEARRLEELAGIMNSSNPSPTPTPTTGDNTSSPTTTTPTSGDNTSSPSTTIPSANDPGYDPYLAYWVQTHPGADYSALYYAKYGVYPSNTGAPGNGNPGTNTTENNPGYDPYLAAWAQQTGADYNLLYFAKYGVYPSDSGTPSAPGSGNTDAAGHGYPTVQMDNIQKIKDMYDAQIEAQKLALQEQGDQALSDAQANKDKIAGLYNQQRNAASVDWERQRRNFLEGAATSGLNTGSGSQAELAMMSEYQRTQNNLGAAQAQAETEAERNIADIRRSTQASINEAIAKNDYQKAAALLDEYNAEYNRAVARAEALGQYGDFSGYAAIYGQEAANQMQRTWVMSNPEIALAMGLITQSQYATLTLYKQYPALAMAAGNAGSSGSSGDYSGSGTNDNYKDTLDYLTKHYLEITSKVAEHYNPNP